jgi:hypothetical protein
MGGKTQFIFHVHAGQTTANFLYILVYNTVLTILFLTNTVHVDFIFLHYLVRIKLVIDDLNSIATLH